MIGNEVRGNALESDDFHSAPKPNEWLVMNGEVYNSTESLVTLLKALPPLAKRQDVTLNRLSPKEYDLKVKSLRLIDELNRLEAVWGITIEGPDNSSVVHVESDSLAKKAGLEAGDELLELDGETFSKKRDLLIALAAKGPKSKFSLTISRSGERKTIQMELPDETKP